MPNSTFVNYTHPSEQAERRNRRLVASYIGTHYRNRSRPSSRKVARSSVVTQEGAADSLTGEDKVLQCARASSRSRSRTSSPGAIRASSQTLQLMSINRDNHGHRADPFNAYPIEFRACIPAALDYFLQWYGPTHIIRPEVLSAEQGATVLQQYLQYALHDSLMFEAIVALAQANLSIHRHQERLDKDALYHYSRAVRRLRDMLSEQYGYMQDSILFGITALMGVDFMMNDTAAFEMHLGGVRKIVALRGGVDQLGWPTVLKPHLVGLETFWAYMSENNSREPDQFSRGSHSLDIEHPYHRSPITGLDELIKPLPRGFLALVLNYRLSVPIITLVNRVIIQGRQINQYEEPLPSQSHNAANMQEAEYAMRLLAGTKLTIIERTVCIGILVSILDRTRTERFSGLYLRHMQLHAEKLCRWQHLFEDWDLAEFYLWAALDITGTMLPPKMPNLARDYEADKRFKLLMVVMCKYAHLSWARCLVIAKKFIASNRCIESWHNAWNLGLQHVKQHRDLEMRLR